MSAISYIEENDTICALATGMGRSAIAILRVSGPQAVSIVDGIFVGKKRVAHMETFTAAFGSIVDEDGRFIDESIVLVMRAPHTYTTEDTVEIDLHGGPLVVRSVLDLLIRKGARMAEPGEFTKKAFLGGRIDMTEAEAVMDVIDSLSKSALNASMKQLKGQLRDKIIELREKLLYETAYIESALDDPENYSLDGYSDKLDQTINYIKEEIDKLLRTADEGRLIREGIRTVIVGRPNVGKSSMLNRLLGEERAIVTDIAGTTRDTLEELVDIGGIMLRLVDTAGIRDTDDQVEKIGVDRARDALNDAELVMFLVDAEKGLHQDDLDLAGQLGGKSVILLINKIDKISTDSPESGRLEYIERLTDALKAAEVNSLKEIYTSARTGQGIDLLQNTVREMFFNNELGNEEDGLMITHTRHKEALVEARASLDRVQESINAGMGEDFYTIDLMAAYESLGRIIGQSLEDDLADKIFSEFCMGK
ncbi:MAG: tRNA uridine-5-carboxymethylaminomethyl(34) synthesis GTPase MnmE [Eubacterium sp.]|nr:tRNA uridine-5-carboxymethylaminomethyl(34) synthesis GTPase MnmE [Eubacterium sp.]